MVRPKVKPQKKSRLKLEPYQVILRPLVTEKGVHRATRNNQYAFEVNPLADKLDIRPVTARYPGFTSVSARDLSPGGSKEAPSATAVSVTEVVKEMKLGLPRQPLKSWDISLDVPTNRYVLLRTEAGTGQSARLLIGRVREVE